MLEDSYGRANDQNAQVQDMAELYKFRNLMKPIYNKCNAVLKTEEAEKLGLALKSRHDAYYGKKDFLSIIKCNSFGSCFNTFKTKNNGIAAKLETNKAQPAAQGEDALQNFL